MSKKFLTMACCAVLTAFFSLSAQAIEVKGQVSYPYKGKIFSSKPSDKDKMEAIKQAKLAALKKFSTGFSISEQKLYAGMESDVQANLDKYISNYRVVAEEVDTNLKTLNLVVRVDINDSLLLSEMHKNSPQQPAVQGDGSLFASLFVAREISESKIFDERRTTITQKSSAASTTREASAGSVNESAQTTEKATTGGNTIRKSAVNKYRELATTDFNAAFSTVLTQLGFSHASWALVRAFTGAYDSNEYYDIFYAMRCRLMGRPEVRFKVWDRLFPRRAVPYNELADKVRDQLKEWKDENAYNRPIPHTEDVMFVLDQMWVVSCTARLMAEAEERWRN